MASVRTQYVHYNKCNQLHLRLKNYWEFKTGEAVGSPCSNLPQLSISSWLLSQPPHSFSFRLYNYQAGIFSHSTALPPTLTSCISEESIRDHLYCVSLDHLDGKSWTGEKRRMEEMVGELKRLQLGLFVWAGLPFPSLQCIPQPVLKINHNFLPIWYHQGKHKTNRCISAHFCTMCKRGHTQHPATADLSSTTFSSSLVIPSFCFFLLFL